LQGANTGLNKKENLIIRVIFFSFEVIMTLVLSRISKNILNIANKNRSIRHKPRLHFDPILTQAALNHSRDMAKNHYCDHFNKKGENPTDRIIKLGFDVNSGHYSGAGENCGQIFTGRMLGLGYISHTERGVAVGFMKQWRKSRPHWENILNGNYTSTGIGVATIDGKMFYATQVFYG
jgi:uncharacterized protein YkwD